MTSVVETMHIAAEKGEPVGCIYKMHNDYLSKKAVACIVVQVHFE
jgi:hypothetical protein